ncbi:MAG: ABC transporter ATP-binding protein [Bacillota bacterium]|nr:ABC transporter ATP-binding protein [Bacillota bacterium]
MLEQQSGNLIATNISKHFGGVRAVDDLSFEIPPGIVCGLIGPNGSGKTTTLNLITGTLQLTSGTVRYNGQQINGLKRHEIVRRGISRTFQNLRLFSSLSALDHVILGRYIHCKTPLIPSLLGVRSAVKEDTEAEEKARHYLNMVGLSGYEDVVPHELPYGKRKLLEVARALSTEAACLCLDEPAAGMSEGEIDSLINLIGQLKKQGITIMLIEHRMTLVMTVCDRIVVLNYGKKIAEGDPQTVSNDPLVIQAYLGRRRGGRTQ